MNTLRRLFHRHHRAHRFIDYARYPNPLIVEQCRCGKVRVNPTGKWERR